MAGVALLRTIAGGLLFETVVSSRPALQMELLDLDLLEGEEEYDSQAEKAVNTSVVLGEEAKKSKRARDRVTASKKERQPAEVDGGTEIPSGTARKKTKRPPEKAVKEDPKPEAALAAFRLIPSYKTQHDVLVVSGSLLHCNVCGKSFGTRANVWKTHLDGARHRQKLAQRMAVQPIREALMLPGEKVEFAYRLRVAEAFFEAGIELSKCKGKLKELLEEKRQMRLSVGDASNLSRQAVDTKAGRGGCACSCCRQQYGYLHL